MSHTVLHGPPASWQDDACSTPGVSEAAGMVREELRQALDAYRQPVTYRSPVQREHSVEERFHALSRQWEEETGHLSSISQIVMHPAYQQIIGMGPAVVPLLLNDLVRTKSHWFWALRAITGENPVSHEDRGYIERMAHAWADWGRARGLL